MISKLSKNRAETINKEFPTLALNLGIADI
jgi:hypothetical protein